MKKTMIAALLLLHAAVARCQVPTLEMGQPAPLYKVGEWLKGTPVAALEKGQVYVLDFWATWCGPCKASMPHMSKLARKYPGVQFIAVNVWESKDKTLSDVQTFVNQMGEKMDYPVVMQEGDLMAKAWMDPVEMGIPTVFLVDRNGIIAWLGHPMQLDEQLQRFFHGTLNTIAARDKLRDDIRRQPLIEEFDLKMVDFHGYIRDGIRHFSINTDSIQAHIDALVKQDDNFRFHESVVYQQLQVYLMTDAEKLMQLVRDIVTDPRYKENNGLLSLYDFLRTSESPKPIPADVYKFAAAAYEQETHELAAYLGHDIQPKRFKVLAKWYIKAGDFVKAKAASEKAVDTDRAIVRFSDSLVKN